MRQSDVAPQGTWHRKVFIRSAVSFHSRASTSTPLSGYLRNRELTTALPSRVRYISTGDQSIQLRWRRSCLAINRSLAAVDQHLGP
jgi:hypothetical protein